MLHSSDFAGLSAEVEVDVSSANSGSSLSGSLMMNSDTGLPPWCITNPSEDYLAITLPFVYQVSSIEFKDSNLETFQMDFSLDGSSWNVYQDLKKSVNREVNLTWKDPLFYFQNLH